MIPELGEQLSLSWDAAGPWQEPGQFWDPGDRDVPLIELSLHQGQQMSMRARLEPLPLFSP